MKQYQKLASLCIIIFLFLSCSQIVCAKEKTIPPLVRKAPILEQLEKQYMENEKNKYRLEGAMNLLKAQKLEKQDLEKLKKWEEKNKKE